MSLLFNMLSRLVITFLPRSKRLLISWLQSPSAVILESKKVKSVTVSIVSPFICHEVMGLDTMTLVFWMMSFKPTFSFSSFTFIKRLFSASSFSAIRLDIIFFIWEKSFLKKSKVIWFEIENNLGEQENDKRQNCWNHTFWLQDYKPCTHMVLFNSRTLAPCVAAIPTYLFIAFFMSLFLRLYMKGFSMGVTTVYITEAIALECEL